MNVEKSLILIRVLTGRCLRRVENLQDELLEQPYSPQVEMLVEALSEIRGLLATIHQWQLEDTPIRMKQEKDNIPF